MSPVFGASGHAAGGPHHAHRRRQYGLLPNQPAGNTTTRYAYTPGQTDPPPAPGWPTEHLTGYHAWTRGGLSGVEYDGRKVTTGGVAPRP